MDTKRKKEIKKGKPQGMQMRKVFVILIFVIWCIGGTNVRAQKPADQLQLGIFNLQQLKKFEKESFAEFLADINERDIFSSFRPKASGEVFSLAQEVTLPKLNLVYRGKVEIGEDSIAMLEAEKNGRKKNYFLKVGELFEGYRLVKIQKEFVVVFNQEQGEKKVYFSNKKQKKKPQGTQRKNRGKGKIATD